jgi:hypothetical protein
MTEPIALSATWRLVIVVEDKGMDSGCTHNILQECTNHGRVLEARLEHAESGHVNDLMHMVKDLTPEQGKC